MFSDFSLKNFIYRYQAVKDFFIFSLTIPSSYNLWIPQVFHVVAKIVPNTLKINEPSRKHRQQLPRSPSKIKNLTLILFRQPPHLLCKPFIEPLSWTPLITNKTGRKLLQIDLKLLGLQI